MDAFLFQLQGLPAPTGIGPPMSQLYPEPGTLALLALGSLGLLRRRRRRG